MLGAIVGDHVTGDNVIELHDAVRDRDRDGVRRRLRADGARRARFLASLLGVVLLVNLLGAGDVFGDYVFPPAIFTAAGPSGVSSAPVIC